MKELSAISIRQPWLDLILKGKKRLELREWNASFRGTIALHSPMKIDFHAANYFGYSEPWKLERGKVLGVANLTAVMELNNETYSETIVEHLSTQPFSGIIYAFRFTDVFVLPNPVITRGKLLIYSLEKSISDKIIIQLPANK